MSLQNIRARVPHISTFRLVSKAVSSLIMISVLAGSMPAAPRLAIDAAPRFPQIVGSLNSSLQNRNPLRYRSDISVPTIDTKLALAVFHNAVVFGGEMKSVVLPTLPAGLENAKLPSLGERTYTFFSPVLAFLTPSATTSTSNVTTAHPPQPASVVDFDFDNDGKADIARWRVASTDYRVRNSNGGTYSDFTFSSGAKIAPGDFNGDSKTDAATFNNGTWAYKTSPSATAQTIAFGTAGDVPVAGDYDGDGTRSEWTAPDFVLGVLRRRVSACEWIWLWNLGRLFASRSRGWYADVFRSSGARPLRR